MYTVKVHRIIPSGLIKKPGQSLENVELRATLEKAVIDAKLSVTEILALNEKFFPNGGGFDLFQNGQKKAAFDYYFKDGKIDSFSKKAQSIRIPDSVEMHIDSIRTSSRGCFSMNLKNALKKLQKVLAKDN